MRRDNPDGPDSKPDPNYVASVAGIPANGYTTIRFHDFANVEMNFGFGKGHVLVPVQALDRLLAALCAARTKAIQIGTLKALADSPLSQVPSRVSRQTEMRQPAPDGKIAEAIRLHTENVPPAEIARRLAVGRATVYRWIKGARPNAQASAD